MKSVLKATRKLKNVLLPSASVNEPSPRYYPAFREGKFHKLRPEVEVGHLGDENELGERCILIDVKLPDPEVLEGSPPRNVSRKKLVDDFDVEYQLECHLDPAKIYVAVEGNSVIVRTIPVQKVYTTQHSQRLALESAVAHYNPETGKLSLKMFSTKIHDEVQAFGKVKEKFRLSVVDNHFE